MNFVLESTVVVRAFGMFMNVPTAPSVSANAISALPHRVAGRAKIRLDDERRDDALAVSSCNCMPSSPGKSGAKTCCSLAISIKGASRNGIQGITAFAANRHGSSVARDDEALAAASGCGPLGQRAPSLSMISVAARCGASREMDLLRRKEGRGTLRPSPGESLPGRAIARSSAVAKLHSTHTDKS